MGDGDRAQYQRREQTCAMLRQSTLSDMAGDVKQLIGPEVVDVSLRQRETGQWWRLERT